MITTKQRAHLRGLANSIETIAQIGKGGLSDATVALCDDALTARELVKMRVLETAPQSAREAASELAERLNADVVQVIGSRFVLFRRNAEKPVVTLA